MEKYYIYMHHWWPGFHEKTNGVNVGFFEALFPYTKMKNFEITNDVHKANVLVEAGKPDANMRNRKNWTYKINFIGEPALPDSELYNLVLTHINNVNNCVDLPLSIAYIHCNNLFPKLLNQQKTTYIPQYFCSFIVSNPKCPTRNKLFQLLNEYKKVNSMGEYANNVGQNIPYPYWSQAFLNVIGEHKFMICCENTKMETYSTEKIVNPYIARTIPIYWGTNNVKNIFNQESMLYLEDDSDESIAKLIDRVIELDNDDEKYLEFINRPLLNEHNIQFWNENYTLDALGQKIDNIL